MNENILKCGCKPVVGKHIVVNDKMTTVFFPHGQIFYKGSKAEIISLNPCFGFIIGATVRLPDDRTGHVLLNAWACDCSCEAYQKWLDKYIHLD